mgnify:CR=1
MYLYSKHWEKKKAYRKDISNENIDFTIQSSFIFRDRRWKDAYNAIGRVPPMGRKLKVVYKREGGNIKIITAFWLD